MKHDKKESKLVTGKDGVENSLSLLIRWKREETRIPWSDLFNIAKHRILDLLTDERGLFSASRTELLILVEKVLPEDLLEFPVRAYDRFGIFRCWNFIYLKTLAYLHYFKFV